MLLIWFAPIVKDINKIKKSVSTLCQGRPALNLQLTFQNLNVGCQLTLTQIQHSILKLTYVWCTFTPGTVHKLGQTEGCLRWVLPAWSPGKNVGTFQQTGRACDLIQEGETWWAGSSGGWWPGTFTQETGVHVRVKPKVDIVTVVYSTATTVVL